MMRHVRTVKDKDKKNNKKFMSFCIVDDKLLEKYKNIWTKIEDLQKIKLNSSLVYDDRYIKTNIRTYGNKICANFYGLNLPEDGIKYESFTIPSIDYLLV